MKEIINTGIPSLERGCIFGIQQKLTLYIIPQVLHFMCVCWRSIDEEFSAHRVWLTWACNVSWSLMYSEQQTPPGSMRVTERALGGGGGGSGYCKLLRTSLRSACYCSSMLGG